MKCWPTLSPLSVPELYSVLATWHAFRARPAMDFYESWVVDQQVASGDPEDVYSERWRRQIGQND